MALHRAAWVLPITSPPIADGAVLVQEEEILAVGPFGELRKSLSSKVRLHEHPDSALLPGLVNAHTHLELTPLAGKMLLPQPDFASWLMELFALRAGPAGEMQKEDWEKIHDEVSKTGTCLVGDITNGARLPVNLDERANGIPMVHVFYELLGFNRENLDEGSGGDGMRLFRDAASRNPSVSLAAHAVYSTSASLLVKAKEWCRRNNRPFSIHCAEHEAEVEFLQNGSGFCRRLLENLGRWVPGWPPPGCTPTEYLNRLGILDERTLLIHMVHVSPEEWRTVAQAGSKVCFCPRSNANLNVGRPDIPAALKHGITCALGTDSLASNRDLNLFSEAVFTLEQVTGIHPGDLLPMITAHGAAALQKGHRAGSLQPGRSSAFLAVKIPGSVQLPELSETVIYRGHEGAWQWACPTDN